ncbi:MAG: 4Fe-4S dicluster domain-containing protein [Thermodesulfobacteriota bacterium]
MPSISIIPERCTGCHSCEMVCSLAHEGSCSSSLSRIRMKKWEEISVFIPVVCQQCEKPPCMTICPTGARKRVAKTGAVVTDGKRCVGCKSCLYACPYNAPAIHPITKRTITCDLCDGQPLCTRVCTTGALSYIPEGDLSMERKKAFGEIFLQSMKSTRRLKAEDGPSARIRLNGSR